MKEFKYLKTFESFSVSGEELNEGFFKKTPEELKEIGQKTIQKDSKTKNVYNTILKDIKNGKYPEDSADKYLMWIAKNGPGGIFGTGIQSFAATWYKDLEAPDKTMGYWGDRAKISGGTGSKNMGA
jgi:hypothetical protein